MESMNENEKQHLLSLASQGSEAALQIIRDRIESLESQCQEQERQIGELVLRNQKLENYNANADKRIQSMRSMVVETVTEVDQMLDNLEEAS